MTSDGRAQKFHTDDVLLLRSWWCLWLVWSREKFASTNQKHWVVTRAAWNLYTLSSHLISRETSGDVSKGRLFSQGYFIVLRNKVFVISSILLLRKKSQQSIFKMFQTVQVLDSLERQWSSKTEELKPHISVTFLHIWIFVSSIMPPDTKKNYWDA